MSTFLNYPSNIFSDLNNTPKEIVTTNIHPLWVTSLIVCNRGVAPLRFNLQKFRLTGTELEEPCYAASTINVNATYNNGINGIGATLTSNASGSFFIDGINPLLNSRILIKNQTNPSQNGIYTLNVVGDNVTPWVLSRSIGYDNINEIQAGDVVDVLKGTVNSNTRWKQTSVVTAIGTSPITFISETSVSMYIINELEINSYSTVNVIDTTGVIQLDFTRFPYVSDSLVCFSNGYTQVFDCDINYVELKELP